MYLCRISDRVNCIYRYGAVCRTSAKNAKTQKTAHPRTHTHTHTPNTHTHKTPTPYGTHENPKSHVQIFVIIPGTRGQLYNFLLLKILVLLVTNLTYILRLKK